MTSQTTLDDFLKRNVPHETKSEKDSRCRLLVVDPAGEYDCLVGGKIAYPETCEQCPYPDQHFLLLQRYTTHPLCYFCQVNLGIRQGFLGSSKRIYTCFWCYELLNPQI